jgi:four helix bundle protein
MSGNYQDLKVWKKSLDLTIAVYNCTSDFPKYELHGLAHQMRRAAVSVPSNIAEGKGRSTDCDFAYFLCHARGSLYELETQTLIARKLGYLSENYSAKLGELSAEAGRMLNGLISSMREKVSHGHTASVWLKTGD